LKTIIFYTSTHHGNTEKIAQAIGEVLAAEMQSLDHGDIQPGDVSKYDLIGLGSGVYRFGLSPKLYRLVDRLDLKGKKVFLFSTSMSGVDVWHKKIKTRLEEKGAILAGEFVCQGFIDWAFFKWADGGMNQGKPDATDLANARKFAETLKKQAGKK
jgi:flavodoxin